MPYGQHSVHRFKYLGSWITTDGRDDLDVDERIAAAGKQFGALRKCLFASADITPQAKHVVYTTLVLNALLYGGESWCLPEHLHRRLHRFLLEYRKSLVPVGPTGDPAV